MQTNLLLKIENANEFIDANEFDPKKESAKNRNNANEIFKRKVR